MSAQPSTRVGEWDAEKLERAAKYMRELDRSKNAAAAIELARREQDVELARQAAVGKQADAARVAEMGNVERVRWEEQRKTIEFKNKHEMAKVEYQLRGEQELLRHKDQLSRKRDEENRRAALEDERAKMAIRRQAEEELQAVRRKADEHRAQLDRESMRVRALAEAEGRIREQRTNEDVLARAALLRLEQERRTRLESIGAVFTHFSTHAATFLSDPQRLTTTVLTLTALAGGVYGMREAARVTGRMIEKRLGTPSLVRETSRFGGLAGLPRRFAHAVALSGMQEGYSLNDVIVDPELQTRLERLAVSIKNTRRNAAPHRHLLFYGPPGTGKTMVAKRLARASGMDYAVMSGGDVGPLARGAVTEIHRLFDWARASPRGLLLFVDEADAFLASRSRVGMSEDQRNALNALLFQTGEARRDCMLVLASNRPGDLDAAVADRVDDAMSFDLPDMASRAKLVRQYFDRYVVRAGEDARWGPWGIFAVSSARVTVAPDIDDAYLKDIARRTEGFSGREISKLFIAAQGAVYGSDAPALSRALLEETLTWKLREHRAKRGGFSSGGGAGGGARQGGSDAGEATSAAAAPPRSVVADFVDALSAPPPPPRDGGGPTPPPQGPPAGSPGGGTASSAAADPPVSGLQAAPATQEVAPAVAQPAADGPQAPPKALPAPAVAPLAVPVGGAGAGLTDI